MPQTLSYPGVYVEEIPSGVRTIVGVGTSITAFVGWAPRGQVDEAVRVLSWNDYDRLFGGLNRDSDLSYAVSQYFGAGGQEAYVVRVADPDAGFGEFSVDDLTLRATGPGRWTEAYGVTIVVREADDSAADAPPRFGLTIFRRTPDGSQLVEEVFENLSLDRGAARFVESVVNELSQIVNAKVGDGTAVSEVADGAFTGGTDGEVLTPSDPEFWDRVWPTDADDDGLLGGVNHLDRIDLFNLLCVPGLVDRDHLQTLAAFCKERRAFLIADAENVRRQDAVVPISGEAGTNAALYYPWVRIADPLQEGRLRAYPPSGVVAGVYARTDATRGVWKAPAGIDASLGGVRDLTQAVTDLQSGRLNQKGVNALRVFPVYGAVVWGARTCRGDDATGSEWKYVPVRRTALYLEESLRRSLQWVVFEPNDAPLWGQIRLNVGAFLHDQFRKGAFQGASPRDAYFVRCDATTTTQNDINLGIVNIVVGFAPLRPAEFVVLKLQQMAGQVQT